MSHHKNCFATVGLLVLSSAVAWAQAGHLTVKVDQPGVKISPKFYGLMTEEINHSYDGGLYGELIQNRALRDMPTEPVHWSALGNSTIAVDDSQAVPGTALTHSLRVQIPAGATGGVANDGFWGFPVKPNTSYKFSFYAKAAAGFSGPIQLSLEGADGTSVAATRLRSIGTEWKQYRAVLRTGKVSASIASRFVMTADKPGTLWMTQVSLFGPSFKNRPNGNRIDLMQLMGEMNPSFLRLPGGNYLEGNTIPDRFNWKETIGEISLRPGHWGPWRYRSSDGLGLLEFLEWCEDLHMEPLLAVYAGYSLQGDHVEPGVDLQPYVQDALDEIEYVTGGTDTKWGAIRAKNGHPKPFPLTYVEIGNEDWFDRARTYDARFAQFFDAIRAKYPKLQIISTADVASRKPDVVDEHFYRSAYDMERDVHHYDGYDRRGPRIFVGEWATTEGSPTPTYQAALADAAWMTGMERNSDIVVMEAYAPLLVNVNQGGRQWGTNLIGYDALNSFGSPSFYVQSLFGKNTGDAVLPVELTNPPAPQPTVEPPHGKIGLGTWSTDSEYKDIEVTQDGATLYKKDFSAGSSDWTLGAGNWSVDEGALRQSSRNDGSFSSAGDVAWTDYTYRVKAKKLAGSEGFLVLFHVKDDQNFWQLNIGGWGNNQSAIQRVQDGANDAVKRVRGVRIETGRWYDIRVELKGTSIKGYLDDKLVIEAEETARPPLDPIYVAASQVTGKGDVILKVVNVSNSPKTMLVDLDGVKEVSPTATAWEMTGHPTDVNSIGEPTKVAPRPVTISGISRSFSHEFPAYSVTVLRLRVKK